MYSSTDIKLKIFRTGNFTYSEDTIFSEKSLHILFAVAFGLRMVHFSSTLKIKELQIPTKIVIDK